MEKKGNNLKDEERIVKHFVVRKTGLLTKLLFLLLVVALIVGVTFYFTRKKYINRVKTVEVTKNVEKIVKRDVVISGETIKMAMKNIGKLSTAEYTFTHVEKVNSQKEIKGFKIPFTKNSFIYSYDGMITAGIDFTEIDIQKDDASKKISVILPEVKIHSSELDETSFKLYDESNNIFNPIKVSDVADSFKHLKETEEEKAINKGLIERAKKNAISMVENFMHGSYNVTDYSITVKFKNE